MGFFLARVRSPMALGPWGSLFLVGEEPFGHRAMGLLLIGEEHHDPKVMVFLLASKKPYGPRAIGSCIVLASRNPMAPRPKVLLCIPRV